ncbi:Pentatricopeptide repeat-containing protein DOT4, chloroplastic [Ananas comosus]|uniref:Pentatricopeptide repeat-containing protein DOT4, chloroplastic n=1 Tax=Ananas comosus TaxID=4615 RepID=A0A199UJK0_ANACO|nr:Pentatricopeptide repeat-containing protein DOT4, chloroplastic [Ananas comosus]
MAFPLLTSNSLQPPPSKDPSHWNSFLKQQAKLKNDHSILETYACIESLAIPLAGIKPALPLVLKACARLQHVDIGKKIHSDISRCDQLAGDVRIATALVDFYCKCGFLDDARVVFDEMSKRDLVSWNAMICGCVGNCMYEDAVKLFYRMREEELEPNSVTLESQPHIGTSLIGFYSRFGLKYARDVFDSMTMRSTACWNAIMCELLKTGDVSEALDIFSHMLEELVAPDSVTLIAVLQSCAESENSVLGKQVHQLAIKMGYASHEFVGNALIDLYGKCGDPRASFIVFEKMLTKDLASWNAMISAYKNCKLYDRALDLFWRMKVEAVDENTITIAATLYVCAQSGDFDKGKCLHGYIVRRELGFSSDIQVGNALLTMYAKCGSLSNAENIFRNLAAKDIISWNAMIAAYGMHGRGDDALCVFNEMLECGMRPTGVTFVSALFACSHSGLVEKGVQLFKSMNSDYNIKPETIHYACFVDLLARSGNIDKAIDLVNSLPVNPDSSIWRALLSSCKVLSDIELARAVTEKLIELEPQNIGNYILPSNIYAAVGSWEDVQELRARIEGLGLKKDPGNSWLFIRDELQSFTSREQIRSCI